MGLIATDTSQTVEFSIPEDKGPDPTVFILRPLDMRERSFVVSKLEKGTTIKPIEGKEEALVEHGVITPESLVDGTIWAVRLGLVGWRNFLTKTGGPVEMKTETVVIPGIGTRTVLTEECVLGSFEKSWVDDIGGEILRLNKFSRNERKN